MKNRRHVCNARDAGYNEYPGLPGKVKTGCMMTPEYKSRYCNQHQLRSCNFDVYEEISDGDMDEHAKGIYYLPMYIYTSSDVQCCHVLSGTSQKSIVTLTDCNTA